MAVTIWADRAARTGMEWVGRAVMRGLVDPAGAADPPPAVDPGATARRPIGPPRSRREGRQSLSGSLPQFISE